MRTLPRPRIPYIRPQKMPVSRPSLLTLLRQYRPFDATEADHLRTITAFVEEYENSYQRSNLAGQVTASAWVVNSARDRVLLIRHRKLNRWLQPGGHLEAADATLAQAVLREVREETGLTGRVIGKGLYDVDAHLIPARREVPAHVHHDLRLLVEVDEGHALLGDAAEVTDLRWFDGRGLETLRMEPSVWRLWQKLPSG